ncbi:MAG: endonuclease/exonuclease/phosphatase family protein [Verrucomicrobia bacterium]|nr:endonuclease/exonuclease/phosphatase family protein [Verrucomicrobiota bacterium]
MTYNLRYASPQGPEAWPLRRPAMKALLEEQAPDLMGTQEGVYGQLRDLASDLPAHDWIGTGRDGGSRGEFMAVFYRRDRFEPLAYDHFWLSDTPEVIGSSTWGNPNRRMVTSVQFRDRRTGLEFHLWNTHLDHALQPAREKGAALIRTRLARLPSSDRVILMGDFNAVATRNVVYEALTREIGFTDSWFSAARRRNETLNSFNGFGKSTFNSARIDWILYRGAAEVSLAEVVDLAPGGRQPSDHFPVVARLRWT